MFYVLYCGCYSDYTFITVSNFELLCFHENNCYFDTDLVMKSNEMSSMCESSLSEVLGI